MGKTMGDQMDVKRSMGNVGENYTMPFEPNDYLNYSNTKKSRGIIVQKAYAEYQNTGGENFKAQEKIYFTLPAKNWVDLNKILLEMPVVILNAAGQAYTGYQPGSGPESHHWIRMKNSAHSMIKELKIRSGQSAALETHTDYNIFAKFVQLFALPREYVEGRGFLLEGMHDENTPALQFMANYRSQSDQIGNKNTVAGYKYYLPIHAIITTLGKYLPIAFTGAIELEILLAPNAEVLLCSVGNRLKNYNPINDTSNINDSILADVGPFNTSMIRKNAHHGNTLTESSTIQVPYSQYYYEVRKPKIWVPTINPVDQYNAKVKSIMESGTMMKVHGNAFRVHRYYLKQIPQGVLYIPIRENVSDLQSVYFTFINHGTNAETWGSRVLENSFHHNNLINYRIKIAEEYTPINWIDTSSGKWPLMYLEEALGTGESIENQFTFDIHKEYRPMAEELLRLEGKWKADQCFKAPHSSKFWAGLTFNTSQGQVSGEDLIRTQAPIEFQLEFDTTNGDLAAGEANAPARSVCQLPVNGRGRCLYNVDDRMPYVSYNQAHTAANIDSLAAGLQPPYSSKNIVVIGTPNLVAGDYDVNAGGVTQFGIAPTSRMLVGTALSETLGKTHFESGWSSPAIVYEGANGQGVGSYNLGLPNSTIPWCITAVDEAASNFTMKDLVVQRPHPTSVDFVCITQFSVVYIFETFNTISLSTDVYSPE